MSSGLLCRGKNITQELIHVSFVPIVPPLHLPSQSARRVHAGATSRRTACGRADRRSNQHKMMDLLGIKALRPGPSGNEKAPNHRQLRESIANPFPILHDPLTLNNGQKVTTEKMWWEQRRPEIVEMYSKYVYGRVPSSVPKVTWTVTAVDHEMIAFTPVTAKDLIGTVDNSGDPAISVHIHMTLVTPAFCQRAGAGADDVRPRRVPNPNEPAGTISDRINKALKVLLLQQDPRSRMFLPRSRMGAAQGELFFQRPDLNEDGDLPNTWQLIAPGWGLS